MNESHPSKRIGTRLWKQIGKIILAGIVSVVILSVLLCAYSVHPIRVANPNENTDYVREPNALYVKMMEGTAWGHFDTNGYNNAEVVDAPDILIVGSSHMEAANVMQYQSTASRLSELLEGRYTVYNVGMARHRLARTFQYLERNIQVYGENLKAVVIEVSSVNLTNEILEQILSGTVYQKKTYDTGVIALLQKSPFINQLYKQLEGGLFGLNASTSEEEPAPDAEAYTELFSYLAELEAEYGVQMIIFYHPTGTLMEDGSISFPDDEALALFSENAATYGINFIDMTDAFEEMYYSEHHVAHGFANTELETGHLNKYGHAAIANALYDEINAMEEAGLICK